MEVYSHTIVEGTNSFEKAISGTGFKQDLQEGSIKLNSMYVQNCS